MPHYIEWIPESVKVLRGDMTLKELSEKSGFSVSYLSDIERGRTIPTIQALDKIFSACGVTLTLGYQKDYVPPGYLYIKREDVKSLRELCKKFLGEE